MATAFQDSLNFTLPDSATLGEKSSNFSVISISNQHADAEISIQGAHIYRFQPKGHTPVLWLSEQSFFESDKAIRGGIPLCWPWFGDHGSDPQLPAHGFARTAPFELLNIQDDPLGQTQITLRLTHQSFNQSYWPEAFILDVAITVGQSLTVSMTMYNQSQSPCVFGSALHSYFHISDINQVSIKGLDQATYYDKVKDFEMDTHNGDITFDQEVDRVFVGTKEAVTIIDSGLNRSITISKSGSESTVIWNPWVDKAATMKDLHHGGYQTMVCVETANALDDTRTIAGNASHTISTTIAVNHL